MPCSARGTHLQVLKHETRASLCLAACCTDMRTTCSCARQDERRTPAFVCNPSPCAVAGAHANSVCRMARVVGHCTGCICAQQRRSSPRLGRLRSAARVPGTARCCILSLSVMLVPTCDACAPHDYRRLCTRALCSVKMQPNMFSRTSLSLLVRAGAQQTFGSLYPTAVRMRHGGT